MRWRARFRRRTATGHEQIAAAVRAVALAHLDLAWALQAACPGQHEYGNHAGGEWCCRCGYDRDGKRISTTPCEGTTR